MKLEDISQTFKALSDPTRLRIVYLLLQKESLCVCELVDTLELSQSTVSRHLAYLKNSNLVTSWRKGVWMHYAVSEEYLSIVNIEFLQTKLIETAEVKSDSNRTSACETSCAKE